MVSSDGSLFRITVEERDGVRRLSLYVSEGIRAAILGRILLALLGPFALVQAVVVKRALASRNPRYAPGAGLFRHTVGAVPYACAAYDRFVPRRLRRTNRCPVILRDSPTGGFELGTERAIIVDNFYQDPLTVRQSALALDYRYFDGSWSTTASSSERWFHELNPIAEEARIRLGDILGDHLEAESFYADCLGEVPGWNGCFNIKLAEDWLDILPSEIHNHANLPRGSMVGVLYLDDYRVVSSGTTFWSALRTGRASASSRVYDGRTFLYRPVARVEASFNRLVLFPSTVLHRGEPGYGHSPASGRLFQLFFFTPGVPQPAS